jgi:hypothetical protein
MPKWDEMMADATSIPEHLRSVRSRVLMIDAGLAIHLLGSNLDNYRKPSKLHINKLAKDIKSNLWSFTNASIAFDVDGKLVDGQHRLMAISMTDKRVPVLVVDGLPSQSCGNPAADTGMKRMASHHLHKNGVANSKDVAATARKICGLVLSNEDAVDKSMTDSAVVQTVIENPDIETSVHKMICSKRLCSVSVASAWYWVARQVNESLADEFAECLLGQKECTSFDPAIKLREVLLAAKNKNERMPFSRHVNLFFSAWQKKLEGLPVRNLREQKELTIPSFVKKRIESMRMTTIS